MIPIAIYKVMHATSLQTPASFLAEQTSPLWVERSEYTAGKPSTNLKLFKHLDNVNSVIAIKKAGANTENQEQGMPQYPYIMQLIA